MGRRAVATNTTAERRKNETTTPYDWPTCRKSDGVVFDYVWADYDLTESVSQGMSVSNTKADEGRSGDERMQEIINDWCRYASPYCCADVPACTLRM